MTRKTDELTTRLTDIISGWKGVDCICIDRRSCDDEYDPHFALVLDVYYRRGIPPAEQREKMFGFPGAFEAAAGGRTKDRFFLEEIPIRVEYKHIPSIQQIVTKPLHSIKLLKNSGTYPLYRLLNSSIAYQASDWINQMRSFLEAYPEEAWTMLFESFSLKMEHYLSDLGAASVMDNRFFHIMSLAGFLRYAGASLFMVNHAFEPSHAEFAGRLLSLPKLPANFASVWTTITDENSEPNEFRRFELARLLAREIIVMHP